MPSPLSQSSLVWRLFWLRTVFFWGKSSPGWAHYKSKRCLWNLSVISHLKCFVALKFLFWNKLYNFLSCKNCIPPLFTNAVNSCLVFSRDHHVTSLFITLSWLRQSSHMLSVWSRSLSSPLSAVCPAASCFFVACLGDRGGQARLPRCLRSA